MEDKEKQLKELLEIIGTNQKLSVEIIHILINCLKDIMNDCTDVLIGAGKILNLLKDGNEVSVKTAILQEGACAFSKIISEKVSKCFNEYLKKYEIMLKGYLEKNVNQQTEENNIDVG